MSEELDIPATLAKLETYGGVPPLSPIERILAGHTGTVVLLLSLYFNKAVEVVVTKQEETSHADIVPPPNDLSPGVVGTAGKVESVILRSVELKAGPRVVATASTVIPIDKNNAQVLEEIRRRELGLGHIAVKLRIPTERTIISIEVTDEFLSRTYVMQGREPLFSGPGLYYTITETFPRALYRPTVHPERWAPTVREVAGGDVHE